MTETSAWLAVARKDFADAARSKMLWALSALMILFVGVATYVPHALNEDPAIEDALMFMLSPMLLLIPILGLIVGYMSIIGERDTGSIRALLGLPIVRSEVLAGKFVGRLGVLALPIVVGFLVGTAVAVALYGSLPGQSYVGFVAVALLIGVFYVALAVSISASVATRGKAMALAVTSVIVFEYLWNVIAMGLYYLLNREMPVMTDLPNWYRFFLRLAPTNAIGTFLSGIFEYPGAMSFTGLPAPIKAEYANSAFYLQEWFSGIVALLWIAVPLAIGYYRFERATIS